MKLTIGSPAPAFSLPTTDGGEVSLTKLRGQKVLLYFYPKDQTPGCTLQACDLRDSFAAIKRAGVTVLGVSKDSIDSHDKFREKYTLPFALLSDEDNEVAKSYGAYGQKMMYGKQVTGTIRSSFLIDEKGKLAAVWSPVKAKGHIDKVLAAVRGEAKTLPAKAAPKRTAKRA